MTHIFEVLDTEHECSLQVMPQRDGTVCFQFESWAGDKRVQERLVLDPDEAIAWTRAIHLCARRARRLGADNGEAE